MLIFGIISYVFAVEPCVGYQEPTEAEKVELLSAYQALLDAQSELVVAEKVEVATTPVAPQPAPVAISEPLTHIYGMLTVLVPQETTDVRGDATSWKKYPVKNGITHIPAVEGKRLLINGALNNEVNREYLDKRSITLVTEDGQELTLTPENAGTVDFKKDPNLEYSLINGKLALVPR